jgi:hypothetical protein
LPQFGLDITTNRMGRVRDLLDPRRPLQSVEGAPSIDRSR